MANTKISQLPSWSGTAADLRWFVMNNSGETETYKFSGYSSPYRWNSSNSGITEVNTTKSSTFNARGLTNTETANSFSNFVIGKGNTTGSIGMFMFVFGDDNTTTAGDGLGTADAIVNFGRANQIIGPSTHTSFVFGRGCIASAPRTFIFGEDTQTSGADSIAMGRQNYGNAYESTSIGGSYNRITNSSQSGIFGGTNNTISSTSPYNSIFGGYNNTIGSSRTYAVMLGCSGRTADADNTTYVENIRGFGNFNFGSTNTNTSVTGGVAGGTNNNNTSTRGVIIGGNGNNAGGTSNIVGGENNTANGYVTFAYGTNNTNNAEVAFIGGGASCNAAGQTIGIIGAEQATTVGATNVMKQSFIGGGFQNNITTSLRASIIAGQVNTITSSPDSAIIAGEFNSLSGVGFSFIAGGYGNIISGGTNYSSILGGQFNTNIGNYSSIVAGRYNNILSAATEYSTIIGSYSSTTGGDYSHIFGGINHRIDSPQAVIVGGLGNYIGPQSDNSEMIGSRNSVISGQSQDTTLINTIDTNSDGYDRVVMLGTSGRTASADNTTYVENLHIYRTPSTTVQPISSGTTFTCDLNNGGKAQYSLTGNTTIDITNVRDGQSFMVKTQTNGNYTITWTATGYTFEFEGGIKDPGNTTKDIFVFEVFGTTIYGNRRHNYS